MQKGEVVGVIEMYDEGAHTYFIKKKDGEVVRFIHRHEIEGHHPDQIAIELITAFDTYCA